MQRAAPEPVAASARGDMCDRSLVAPTSAVRSGEPSGLRHPGGSELGLHTGGHRGTANDVSTDFEHNREFCTEPFPSCRTAPWPCRRLSTVKWLCWWPKLIRSTLLTNRTAA